MRQAFYLRAEVAREGAWVCARLLHDGCGHAPLLIQKSEQEVRRKELGVFPSRCVTLRSHQRFARLGREAVQSHESKLSIAIGTVTLLTASACLCIYRAWPRAWS
jgi:hypothetical protein